MRFPSRQLLVAGSVLGALSASGTAAVHLTAAAMQAPEVALPQFAPGLSNAATGIPAPTAPTPTLTTPISGAQIAGHAFTQAQDKAAAIAAAQQQAEAERAAAEQRAAAAAQSPAAQADHDREQMREELRRAIRQACDGGNLRGPICQAAD
ncbi:hypothetical protein [Pseudonocardia acidicola]|uniref:Uncharacterized protein n=1 Tax=Pseudonocardia acidicola TaxID=2724939 RepID=A0ABX1SCC5_9PSEU|nr:hypothetical protein [Pseudonocardia acidicola]NMH98549.1 hypothetical protein [Pseudonocardia acidicola]